MVDYTDFEGSRSPKKRKKRGKVDQVAEMGKAGFWWRETDPGFRAQALAAAANRLEKDQSMRHNMNLLHARLYGNFDITSFGPRQYSRGNAMASAKIAFNIVESGIDSLAAKISKLRPKADFQTDGAKFSEQQKSKRLGQFGEGLFSNAKVYTKDDLLFVDAGVFGSGAYKVIMVDGKVDVERAFVDEIYVDEADAKYGAPRQMIQGKLAHREKLLADYPECAEAIRDAKPPNGVEQAGFGDMVQVWEGWHLPSKKGANDGFHSISLDDGYELLGEKWNLMRFPFVFYHFKPRLLGFWGQGVAEILTGLQLELNRLVRSVSEQLRRKGRGRIFMPLAAKVPPEHLTNAIGDIVYYNGGVAPTVDNSDAVAAEEFAQIDRLWKYGFQLIGVSEMSVSAKKPSGLDAGVALREYEDIESERFAKQHQRWDTFHLELLETMLDFVREFGGPGYVTKYEHKRYMETIKWEDVAHESGEYTIKMMAASGLSASPAGRRQDIKELEASGYIDKTTARALLDLPDVRAEENLGNASRDDVDAMIDRALNSGEVEMPDKYTNLDLLVERGTAMYLFARNHDAGEEALSRLSTLIDNAAAASVAAKQPIMPPGQPTSLPMPGTPPAPGGGQMTQNVNMPVQPSVPPLVG